MNDVTLVYGFWCSKLLSCVTDFGPLWSCEVHSPKSWCTSVLLIGEMVRTHEMTALQEYK